MNQTSSEETEEKHLDGSTTEFFDVVDPSGERLDELLRIVFEERWADIVFGTMVPGSVFEMRFHARPNVGYLDGYLTVGREDDPSHFHLCIGPHIGTKSRPTPPALGAIRRCARAAFYRDADGAGRASSWGLRLWNGQQQQMLNVFFPSPWLSRERMKALREPVWEHLALWNELRARFAGVPADPVPAAANRPAIH